MRTVSNFRVNPRIIGAKITLREIMPVFSRINSDAPNWGVTVDKTKIDYCACEINENKIFQVAVYGDGSYPLAWRVLSGNTIGNWNLENGIMGATNVSCNWITGSIQNPTTVNVITSTGTAYRVHTFNSATLAFTSIGTETVRSGVILSARGWGRGAAVGYIGEKLNIFGGSTQTEPEFRGRITNIKSMRSGFGKIFINRTTNDPVFTDYTYPFKPVIPVDESESIAGLADVFPGTYNCVNYVTGVLIRENGPKLHIYMIGTESFSLGRYSFIDEIDSPGGSMIYSFGKLVYCGLDFVYTADPTMLFLNDNPAKKFETTSVHAISISTQSNSPYSMDIELPTAQDNALMKPGVDVTVAFTVDGSTFSDIGKFNIDSVGRKRTPSGRGLVLRCTSKNMKLLRDYRSDTPFDYWSQIKFQAAPTDMSKVVRVSGSWDATGGLGLKSLNEDGFLYVAEKPVKNGEIMASFTRTNTSSSVLANNGKIVYGVGLGYKVESAYDASGRLGLAVDDVPTDLLLHYGVFAIIEISSTAHVIKICYLHDNEFVTCTYKGSDLLWSEAVGTISDDVKVFFSVIDNYFRLRIVGATVTVKTGVIENYNNVTGMGVIYMKNVTQTCYYEGTIGTDMVFSQMNGFDSTAPILIESEMVRVTPATSTQMTTTDVLHKIKVAHGTSGLNTHKLFDFAPDNNYYGLRTFPTLESGTATDFTVYGIYLPIFRAGTPGELSVVARLTTGTVNSTAYLFDTDMLTTTALNDDTVGVQSQYLYAKFDTPIPFENISSIDFYPARTQSPGEVFRFVAGVMSSAGRSKYITNDGSADVDIVVSSTGRQIAYYLYGKSDVAAPGNGTGQGFYASDSFAVGDTVAVYAAPHVAMDITAETTYNDAQYYEHAQASYNNHGYFDVEPAYFADGTSIKVWKCVKLAIVERGVAGTESVTHPTGILVSTYKKVPFMRVTDIQYYSTDLDLSLEDIIKEVGYKAGVTTYTGDQLTDGSYHPTGIVTLDGSPIRKRNLIVDVTFLSFPTACQYDFHFRKETPYVPGITLSVMMYKHADGFYYHKLVYYRQYGTDNQYAVEVYEHDRQFTKIKISLFGMFLTVWGDGRYIHTFCLETQEQNLTGDYFDLTGTIYGLAIVYISEGSIRIDNHIMDMDRTGLDLIGDIIGEKRFFIQDNQTGLRIFRKRYEITSAYSLSVGGDNTITDSGVSTRVRVEGQEILETIDREMMLDHGNIFKVAHMNELYDLNDAQYFSDVTHEEVGSRIEYQTLSGAADPAIEPNDIIHYGTERMIVDRVDFNFASNPPIFDMSISGRKMRTDL